MTRRPKCTTVKTATHEGTSARYYQRWSKMEDDILLSIILNNKTCGIKTLGSRAARALRDAKLNRTIAACESRVRILRQSIWPFPILKKNW